MEPQLTICLTGFANGDSQFIPKKAEKDAVGYDVRACIQEDEMTIRCGEYVKIPLGFRATISPGYYYELHPR